MRPGGHGTRYSTRHRCTAPAWQRFRLGKYLAQHDRDDYVLSTKVGSLDLDEATGACLDSALPVIVSLVSVSDLRLRRRDPVAQRRDGSEYLGHRLRRDPRGSERVGQVPGDQAEVVHGDAVALMHLPIGAPV